MNDDDGLRDLFVPFTNNPKEYRLNPDAVRNESSYRNCLPCLRDESTRNHNNPEHTLVVKSPNFFVDKGRLVSQTKATVVVGVLFQYSSPAQHRFSSREGRNLANSSLKFSGVTSVTRTAPGFNKIGFFGDVSPRSAATFCMFFRSKHGLHELSGYL